MYIIYCKHIFVYIFPFNWDSSFVTEVFFQKKKERKKYPLQTEALCFSPPVRLSGWKTDFSYWFALKTKTGKGRKARFVVPKLDQPLWWISPASSKHRGGFPGPGWLPFKMARIADKSKGHVRFYQLAAEVLSVSWTRVQPVESRQSNQDCEPQRAQEKTTMWRVSLPAAAESQYPASRVLFFFNSISLTDSLFTSSRRLHLKLHLLLAVWAVRPH